MTAFMTRATPVIAADDQATWQQIAALYPVDPAFVQLENGYFGMQAITVLQACQAYQQQVNSQASFYLRSIFPAKLADIKQQLAVFCGVQPQELLLTRNLAEGMYILLQGYPFSAGDEVLCSGQDYDSVLANLTLLVQQKQIKLQQLALPLDPASDEQLVQLYQAAITPNTKVIVLSHLCHRHGLILPVAKISQMARQYGVDVIVDAAHSFAQLDFLFPQLEADFIVVNLHKWLGAPLGLGLLYIRQQRIAKMQPVYGCNGQPVDHIDKLAFAGTPPVPQILAISDALQLQLAIGSLNKQHRLRYLTQYWLERLTNIDGVQIFAPTTTGAYCAIAAFGLLHVPAAQVVQTLWEEFGIFTVTRQLYQHQVIRITPYLFTQTADLDRLIDAVQQLAVRSAILPSSLSH